ncbi:MAG: hypothetical protein P2A85_06885 [Microcoleus anatoxicus]|uniref:hypothetical protein n=1 Tax=Microcoleus anatoxicus TaxID=2705319 RepID=UPI003670A08D
MRQSIRAIGLRNKVDIGLTKYSTCGMHLWWNFLRAIALYFPKRAIAIDPNSFPSSLSRRSESIRYSFSN